MATPPELENGSHPLFAGDSKPVRRPGPRAAVTLPEIVSVCEALYAKHGFVQWQTVGDAVGLSRQGVRMRVSRAVERGALTQEQLDRWSSITTRAALTREQAKRGLEAKREREKLVLRITFTPENAAWLRKAAALQGVRISDVLNGCVTRMGEEEQRAAGI